MDIAKPNEETKLPAIMTGRNPNLLDKLPAMGAQNKIFFFLLIINLFNIVSSFILHKIKIQIFLQIILFLIL